MGLGLVARRLGTPQNKYSIKSNDILIPNLTFGIRIEVSKKLAMKKLRYKIRTDWVFYLIPDTASFQN